MDATEKIKEYIAKQDDWREDLLSQIRDIVLKTIPGVKEEWKWNSPVWSGKGMICSAGAFKKHVSLTFFKGALLKDKDKLFNSGSDSKNHRSINYSEGDKVEKAALTALIKEAATLDKG